MVTLSIKSLSIDFGKISLNLIVKTFTVVSVNSFKSEFSGNFVKFDFQNLR